jgi:hypothetical protein
MLTSPPYTTPADGKLTFFYWMSGSEVGSLAVYEGGVAGGDIEGSADASDIWHRSGDQGAQWNYACTNLLSQITNSTLQFRATSGAASNDIAVDDVLVSEGPCQGDYKLLLL